MSGTVDLRTLFFDDPGEASEALAAAMLGKPGDEIGTTLGGMPAAARKAAVSRLTDAATGLLEQDVTDIFGNAWRKHEAIRAAAQATLDEPGSERKVDLATHAIAFAHEPSVELRIGDRKVATVALQIQLDLLVKGLLGVIKNGRLMRLQGGVCDVDGSLTVAGMQVAQRQVTLQLPLSLRLRTGWPLLDQVPADT
jgi:hypothetical protein